MPECQATSLAAVAVQPSGNGCVASEPSMFSKSSFKSTLVLRLAAFSGVLTAAIAFGSLNAVNFCALDCRHPGNKNRSNSAIATPQLGKRFSFIG